MNLKINAIIRRLLQITLLLLFTIFSFSSAVFAQALFPGNIVSQSPNPLKAHFASPSIAILPNGSYVVSHDWSGSSISGIHFSIYTSHNKGLTWELLTIIQDMRWANLFVYQGDLYLMGLNKGMGDILVRKSTDGGRTWTTAKDKKTGVIAEGRYHTGPVPMVIHKGRIWRAFEESPDIKNERDFHAFVMSAPLGADLLKAASWTMTNKVAFNPDWLNADKPTWLEGNVVVNPEGKLINMLRVESKQIEGKAFDLTGGAIGISRYEVAAFIDVTDDGKTATFNPDKNFIHFPGAQSKFVIRYDSVSSKYWAISNKISTIPKTWSKNSNYGAWNQRNVLILSSSSDLKHWETKYKILKWNEGKIVTRLENFGFHYPDWQFEGNDIILASRTSWYSANWHNANMITFHRVKDFRKTTLAASPADLGPLTKSPDTILSWDFNGTKSTGTEIEAISSFTDSRLEVGKLYRGAGLKNDKSFSHSFSASSTSYVNTQNKKTNALANDEFFQFEVQAKKGFNVSVSTLEFKLARNLNGARNYRLAFSTDGEHFSEVGTGDIAELTDSIIDGVKQPMVQLVNYNELKDVPSVQKIYFRVYVWGAKHSNGRISLGKATAIIVGGIIVPDRPQPEPLLSWSMKNRSENLPNPLPNTTKNDSVEESILTRGTGANQDYYAFSFKPKAGKYISLSSLNFSLKRNLTGPMIYQWRYSLDGKSFKDLAKAMPFLAKDVNGVDQPVVNLSSRTDLQNIPAGKEIYFRLYMRGATKDGGIMEIGKDGLALYGEVSPKSASKEKIVKTN